MTRTRKESTERWRPIEGWEGFYSVSDQGRVRSEERVDPLGRPVRERILRGFSAGRWGHLKVSIYRDGDEATVFVHRLVLETFVGPCPEGMECRHLNGDPADNRLRNLAWGTIEENRADAARHGTLAKGERHGLSKLTREASRVICRLATKERVPQRWLGRQFGVSEATVRGIKTGRSWGWATKDIHSEDVEWKQT